MTEEDRKELLRQRDETREALGKNITWEQRLRLMMLIKAINRELADCDLMTSELLRVKEMPEE